MEVRRRRHTDDCNVPGHHPGEEVLLILRRHWFVLALIILLFIFLGFLPLLVGFLLPDGFLASLRGSVWEGILTLALGAYALFLWLFFVTAFVDYYLDVWIVTDERIIDIHQAGLFRRVISEQRIVRVQDVSSDVRGIFPTFLDFGNVYVQTAGETPRFTFMQVPHPREVKQVILKAYEDAIRGRGPETRDAADQARADVGSMVEPHLHPPAPEGRDGPV